MLYRAEQELASMLAAWPAAEDHVIQLFELDPTHVAAQAADEETGTTRRSSNASRPSLPFCLFSELPPAAPLLELDPVHLYCASC